MAKTLNQSAKKIQVAKVEMAGEKMILPNGMTPRQAIKVLEELDEYQNKKVVISMNFPVFPWDGANALNEVIAKRYGWTQSVATPGFWGDEPPQLRRIQIAYDKYVEVPWGRITLPSISGFIVTGATTIRGQLCFSVAAEIKRKDEATVRDLFDAVGEYLKTTSIYQGKAIKIRFKDDNGNMLEMPEPEFLDVSKIKRSDMIFSRDTEKLIDVNLLTPIERIKELGTNGIPAKRGVLLGGVYGTGKTLAANVASRVCVDNDVTFLYVPRGDELAHAVQFARQYQRPACTIFCEDIDRVTEGERSVKMDDILNIIDGIDSKKSNIQIILTTNHMDKINPAMIRPGRLDAVIEIDAPDAEAVQRLLRLYAGDTIAPDTNLEQIGERLKGAIPAVIAEVVNRAKLAQLSLLPEGRLVEELSEEALLVTIATLDGQRKMLEPKAPPAHEPSLEDMVKTGVSRAFGHNSALRQELVKHIANEVETRF